MLTGKRVSLTLQKSFWKRFHSLIYNESCFFVLFWFGFSHIISTENIETCSKIKRMHCVFHYLKVSFKFFQLSAIWFIIFPLLSPLGNLLANLSFVCNSVKPDEIHVPSSLISSFSLPLTFEFRNFKVFYCLTIWWANLLLLPLPLLTLSTFNRKPFRRTKKQSVNGYFSLEYFFLLPFFYSRKLSEFWEQKWECVLFLEFSRLPDANGGIPLSSAFVRKNIYEICFVLWNFALCGW